jgi:endo-1,4-beta-D-glucanase Y
VPLSTPALAATSRPFPQHVAYSAGVMKPTNVTQAQMDDAVKRHYAAWKTKYLRNTGGEYWVMYQPDKTVSEAHGYGMVLTAYMGDKAIFDSMFAISGPIPA